mmetsp:Transcript_47208/g.120431  ORF Transcript_47208/g.120431 Transcript_47208/m.120431 type:complete len:236 (-) Transcript_47208:2947-3654(-)
MLCLAVPELMITFTGRSSPTSCSSSSRLRGGSMTVVGAPLITKSLSSSIQRPAEVGSRSRMQKSVLGSSVERYWRVGRICDIVEYATRLRRLPLKEVRPKTESVPIPGEVWGRCSVRNTGSELLRPRETGLRRRLPVGSPVGELDGSGTGSAGCANFMFRAFIVLLAASFDLSPCPPSSPSSGSGSGATTPGTRGSLRTTDSMRASARVPPSPPSPACPSSSPAKDTPPASERAP